MPKRSVETAWKLLVDGYLPFVKKAASHQPRPANPPGTGPELDPRHRRRGRLAGTQVRANRRARCSVVAGAPPDQSAHGVSARIVVEAARVDDSRAVGGRAPGAAARDSGGRTRSRGSRSRGTTVTYANLFSHRSGLPNHAGDVLEDLGCSIATPSWDRLGKLALNPIGRYAYTNFGLTAAAVRAAELAGETSEDVADRLLYRKLDMHSTSSRFETFRARANRKGGIRRGADGRFSRPRSATPMRSRPLAAMGGVGARSDRVDEAAARQSRHTTQGRARDFKWIEQTHCRYVDEESYGYGWNVQIDDQGRVNMLSHSGAFDMGAGTSVALWPQEQLGIVALTNAEPTGAAEALCAGFRQLFDDDQLTVEQLQTRKGPSREHPDRQLTFLANVADSMRALLRPPRRDAGQTTPGTLFAFAGTYASDFYGEARFAFEG